MGRIDEYTPVQDQQRAENHPVTLFVDRLLESIKQAEATNNEVARQAYREQIRQTTDFNDVMEEIQRRVVDKHINLDSLSGNNPDEAALLKALDTFTQTHVDRIQTASQDSQ